MDHEKAGGEVMTPEEFKAKYKATSGDELYGLKWFALPLAQKYIHTTRETNEWGTCESDRCARDGAQNVSVWLEIITENRIVIHCWKACQSCHDELSQGVLEALSSPPRARRANGRN